ncbi:MAG: hypothetical protein ABI595_04225 [Actinomycetota bacterium]
MEPLPPPPPPRPDTSWPAQGPVPAPLAGRPQPVTAAGTIIIVLGVLQALAGVVLLVVPPADLGRIASMGDLNIERVVTAAALFVLVVGCLEVLAGILVLRLSDGGRHLAIVLALIGLLGGIGSLSGGSVLGVLTLGLYAFVIFVLFTQSAAFRGTRRG